MPSQSYPAIKIQQTGASSPLVLFSAPATEIHAWSGIVQRQRMGEGEETVGFQRQQNEGRIRQLTEFYSDARNVIQNPLLCAAQDLARCSFAPADGEGDVGTVTISWVELADESLLDLLKQLKAALEGRLPTVVGEQPPDDLVAQLRRRASEVHDVDLGAEEDDAVADDDESGGEDDTEGEGPLAAVLFSEETHLQDFWAEVAARVQILEEIGQYEEDEFLGFSKEAVAAYIRPVVLVDGQHRLIGAVESAQAALDTDEMQTQIEQALVAGEDAAGLERRLLLEHARQLPVSLLLNESPAEHVFQFVVVNQKATPIGRPLLGTIVSTSLTNEELKGVSTRLSQAGIPLESARAVAYMSRNPESPFHARVQRGLVDEGKDLLPWSVLVSLISLFQELSGGRLFGQKPDYADIWRRNYLPRSTLVVTDGDEEPLEVWKRADGPWREVFLRFWTEVRKYLGSDDVDAGNYWGSPRSSNLFNKVSLTILAADFFQFLTDRGYPLESIDDVSAFVEQWLQGVNPTYFARDWKLDGVKKDSVGIRNQWASIWVNYRKDPVRLPSLKAYRQLKGA